MPRPATAIPLFGHPRVGILVQKAFEMERFSGIQTTEGIACK